MLATSCSPSAPQLGVDPIDDVIAAMTLEEKANFVIGTERMKVTPPDRAPGMNFHVAASAADVRISQTLKF